MTTRRTILHTIETGGPGGAETVLMNLASGIDARRFRSIVFLPYGGWLAARLREHGVEPVIQDKDGGHEIRQIMRLVRRESVDLIHAHLDGQNFSATVAGRLTGAKVVATWHNMPRSIGRWTRRQAFKEWFVRHGATHVVGVSTTVVEALRHHGFSGRRTLAIHNGIDFKMFQSAPAGTLRRELGCEPGTLLVGTVANFRASKNYGALVAAAAEVVRALPNVHFVAAGDVNSEIGAQAREAIARCGLDGRFHLLGLRSDVPAVLADLDIFVLASTAEGFSIATVEAMAAGRPVVATRSGGPAEIIEHGRTGLLVESGSAQALASGILRLIGDAELRVRLANAGRAAVEERFSLPVMICRYESLYEQLLGSAPSAAMVAHGAA